VGVCGAEPFEDESEEKEDTEELGEYTSLNAMLLFELLELLLLFFFKPNMLRIPFFIVKDVNKLY
jgi:hypothetical protein